MNQLICLALWSAIALAGNRPSAALDQQLVWPEVDSLSHERAEFEQFCLEARAEVEASLRGPRRIGSVQLFGALVEAGGQLEVLVRSAVHFAKRTMGPSNAPDYGTLLFLKVNILTRSRRTEMLAELKKQLAQARVRLTPGELCRWIRNSLHGRLNGALNEHKAAILAQIPVGDQQDAGSLASISLDQVGCSATERLSKFQDACQWHESGGKIEPHGRLAALVQQVND